MPLPKALFQMATLPLRLRVWYFFHCGSVVNVTAGRKLVEVVGAWLMFIPTFGATMIGISRTMDYRHHATDVIAGGVLGFIIAISIYHNYYPPLWDNSSQKPYSPRNFAAHRWLHGHSAHDRRHFPTVIPHFARRNETEIMPHQGNDLERNCDTPHPMGTNVSFINRNDPDTLELNHNRPFHVHWFCILGSVSK